MVAAATPVIRLAVPVDVPAICRFGEAHIRAHYAPLIGPEAADAQVRDWWNAAQIGAAVADGLVLVAELSGRLVGVAQRGRRGPEHVVYKLYLEPGQRGRGLGPRLLDAVAEQLPDGSTELHVEHFAGNLRAGEFYEREGFVVRRVQPDPAGQPALAVVWRARRVM